jgi:tRNA A37 threonylcarbamoyladenosine dehydratase
MTDLSQPGQLAAPQADADFARRFGGVARLYGPAAYARFTAAHAVVIGLGGVGSWAAEALARSGVGALTLIDLDHIAESNTNRQIHALDDAYGRAKVLAMAERVAAINPACTVRTIDDFITPDNVATLLPRADAVLDCIDQVAAKAALIAHCCAQRIAVITCGAAGGRVDPLRIRRDDLARVIGDPLLAKVRYRLRRRYGFARELHGRVRKFGVQAIYSDEPVRLPTASAGAHVLANANDDSGACAPVSGGLACAGYGSAVTVTAPMGLAAAAAALGLFAARAASESS